MLCALELSLTTLILFNYGYLFQRFLLLLLCGVQLCCERAYFAKIATFVSVLLIIFYYVSCCLPLHRKQITASNTKQATLYRHLVLHEWNISLTLSVNAYLKRSARELYFSCTHYKLNMLAKWFSIGVTVCRCVNFCIHAVSLWKSFTTPRNPQCIYNECTKHDSLTTTPFNHKVMSSKSVEPAFKVAIIVLLWYTKKNDF